MSTPSRNDHTACPAPTRAGRLRRLGAAALLAVALPVAGLAGAGPAAATAITASGGPKISGAGSTWSQIALDQWRRDVRAQLGLSIEYNGNGSSSGRTFYINDNADFADSEIPFTSDEAARLQSNGKTYQYLPIIAGGTALMYSLKSPGGARVTNLQLSPQTLTRIFTNKITDWGDPAITADNGGRALAAQPITPVVRSDGSGTSAQFTAYMSAVAGDIWGPYASGQSGDPGPTSQYPVSGRQIAQKGSDGVANYVANPATGVGSIGYVEAGYAVERGFPVASVKNASGAYTQPNAFNVAQGLLTATVGPNRIPDLKPVYFNNNAHTYPISSYSYMITPTGTTHGFTAEKGAVLGQFIRYFACDGQQKAAQLGYSPTPPSFAQADFDAVKAIPGAADPGPLSACQNPTITGRGAPTDLGNTPPGRTAAQQVIPPAATGAGATGGSSGVAGTPAGSVGSGSGTAAVGGASAGSATTLGGQVDASGAAGALGGGPVADALGADGTLVAERNPDATLAAAEVRQAAGSHGAGLTSTLLAVAVILLVFVPPTVAAARGNRRRAAQR